MKKINTAALSLFIVISLSGCSEMSGGKPDAVSGMSSVSVEDGSEISYTDEESDVQSLPLDIYFPSGSFSEAKEELTGILTSGGWQFLDGKAHGEEIESADKGKISNSSIWFNNDGTAVFTLEGTDYNIGYEIGKEMDAALYFNTEEEKEALKDYTEDGNLYFYFVNDKKYGMILVEQNHLESVRYFKTQI